MEKKRCQWGQIVRYIGSPVTTCPAVYTWESKRWKVRKPCTHIHVCPFLAGNLYEQHVCTQPSPSYINPRPSIVTGSTGAARVHWSSTWLASLANMADSCKPKTLWTRHENWRRWPKSQFCVGNRRTHGRTSRGNVITITKQPQGTKADSLRQFW